MLLSIMTWARLESYRNSQSVQIVFYDYNERSYINNQADRVYGSIIVQDKEQKPNRNARVDASPRIGIGLLFEPNRGAQAEDWEQTKVLFKKLIHSLYDGQPFYKKIIAKRPLLIDELIDAITKAIDLLPKEKLPKKTGDLANLVLDDFELNQFLYQILRGVPTINGANPEQKESEGQFNLKQDVTSNENEEEVSPSADEYRSPEGFYSVLDYVTGKKNQKIRVYLAPRSVLLAIFSDRTTVENIINERESLFQQALTSEKMDALSETFKNQFERMKDPSIDGNSLNFSVTKTNPKYYR